MSVMHNTARCSSDNIPLHLQTATAAQMLSVGEEGVPEPRNHVLDGSPDSQQEGTLWSNMYPTSLGQRTYLVFTPAGCN